MQLTEIINQAIPYLIALLVLFAIWAVVEVALTLRRARKTLDEVDNAVSKVDPLLEGAKPVIEKASPLVERATLAIDAVNLEIMRVDTILEDVEQMTDVASKATTAVSNVTSAPLDLASGIADKIRSGFKHRSRVHAAEHALGRPIARHGMHTIEKRIPVASQVPLHDSPIKSGASVDDSAEGASAAAPLKGGGYTVITPAVVQDHSMAEFGDTLDMNEDDIE